MPSSSGGAGKNRTGSGRSGGNTQAGMFPSAVISSYIPKEMKLLHTIQLGFLFHASLRGNGR